MSETKFTSGNWAQSHSKDRDGMYNTDVYDEEGETICTLAWHPVYEGNGVTSTDREANANLIKTAPEMYEMLEELLGLDENQMHKSKIQDLLAKARGEHE